MGTYPKGIMLYSSHIKSDGYLTIPSGIDFIVAVALSGMAAESGFNKHVQEAYNANIPCLAMVNVDPTVYSKLFGLADASFPVADKDPYIKILDNLFLTPSKKSIYAIHGIILNIRFSDNTNTGSWIVASVKNLRDLCKERYFDIPVYILTDENVLTLYPDANSDPQVFLSTQNKLCTYSSTELISGNDLIVDPNSSPIPNWKGIKYWWYGSQQFDFLSNLTETYAPILEYCDTYENMYTELNYIKSTSDNTSDVDDTENNEDSENTSGSITYSFDIDEINARLDSLIDIADQILSEFKKVSNHFVDIT